VHTSRICLLKEFSLNLWTWLLYGTAADPPLLHLRESPNPISRGWELLVDLTVIEFNLKVSLWMQGVESARQSLASVVIKEKPALLLDKRARLLQKVGALGWVIGWAKKALGTERTFSIFHDRAASPPLETVDHQRSAHAFFLPHSFTISSILTTLLFPPNRSLA
jgi:hypothetical protein